MITSVAQARADLWGLFASDANGTPVPALWNLGVVGAFGYEPKSVPKGTAVTAFVVNMTPDRFIYEVRVYRSLGDDVVKAQDDLDAVVDAVDGLLGVTGRWGPSSWAFGQTGEGDALLATCRLERIREDF